MLHHLADNGTMAVILPHGALFRGGSEGAIRQILIAERNWLDAVIGLPANIFYGTAIPTCIMVFKKCRESPDDILFIDASGTENFEKAKNQNNLRDTDVERIIATYRNRTVSDRYSHVATMAEIEENDWNLNIPRYVDTFEEEAPVDLSAVLEELNAIDASMAEVDGRIAAFCKELGIEAPLSFRHCVSPNFQELGNRSMEAMLLKAAVNAPRQDCHFIQSQWIKGWCAGTRWTANSQAARQTRPTSGLSRTTTFIT